jgi:hypothetical protein
MVGERTRLMYWCVLVTVPHGKKLIRLLEPGTGVIRDGTGHVFMLEEEKWHNEMIEGQIEKVNKLPVEG